MAQAASRLEGFVAGLGVLTVVDASARWRRSSTFGAAGVRLAINAASTSSFFSLAVPCRLT